jgi:uncharacterized protein (TIGR02117 family)
MLLLPLLYAGATLVFGLLPVNRDFREADQGVDIYVRANAVHTDLLLPIRSSTRDWRGLLKVPGIGQAEYISVGWGDRAFYLETKTWADLHAGNAVRALFGIDSTVLHIEAEAKPRESTEVVRIRIAPEQLERLVTQIDASLMHDAQGLPLLIVGAHYYNNDSFFEAQGHYSMFVTCNEWVRTVLSGAGIRTAWWAPLAAAVHYQAQQIRKP